ncbi:PRC-barrel domain containing protein [Methylobacterium sp. BTF04]|uniref:PRC-barrel domain-containing protein n=1 Tax=Methylobacterium sp. BTF04 TaxID=2708300 RepID=UPI0013D2D747|nr:PRC-barrel domain-containing protein [Methylobacterium sp. BTF04]NEU14045.1 PRC-barrel domain containing protein [Methylobacterium sp. BTF04]
MIAAATITLWAAAAAAEGQPTTGQANPAPGNAEAPASPPVPVPGASAPQAPPAVPPQAQTPPASPPQVLPTGTPATVLDTQDYEGVLGKAVRSSTGEDMGRIIDIILDKDGRPRAAIIDFGGFLGVGSRKIAVDWRSMRFSSDGKPSRLVLQLSRNQVRVSPEYKPGDPIVVLGPASPSAAAEGEQAAAPVVPPPTVPNPAPAPVAPPPADKVPAPEKAPDRPAEKTPDK